MFGSGESLFIEWQLQGIDKGGPRYIGHLTYPDAKVFTRITQFHFTPSSSSAISTQQDGRASASGLYLAGRSGGNARSLVHSSKQTYPLPIDGHRRVVQICVGHCLEE